MTSFDHICLAVLSIVSVVVGTPLLRQEGSVSSSLNSEASPTTKFPLSGINKPTTAPEEKQQAQSEKQMTAIPIKNAVENSLQLGDGLTKDVLRQFFRDLKRFPSLIEKILNSQGYYEVEDGNILNIPSNSSAEREDRQAKWQYIPPFRRRQGTKSMISKLRNKEYVPIQPNQHKELQKDVLLQTNGPFQNVMKTVVTKTDTGEPSPQGKPQSQLQHLLHNVLPNPELIKQKQEAQKRSQDQMLDAKVSRDPVLQNSQEQNTHYSTKTGDDQFSDTNLDPNNKGQVLNKNQDYIYDVETLPYYYYYNYDEDTTDSTKEYESAENEAVDDKTPQDSHDQTDNDKVLTKDSMNKESQDVVKQVKDTNNAALNDVNNDELQLSKLHS